MQINDDQNQVKKTEIVRKKEPESQSKDELNRKKKEVLSRPSSYGKKEVKKEGITPRPMLHEKSEEGKVINSKLPQEKSKYVVTPRERKPYMYVFYSFSVCLFIYLFIIYSSAKVNPSKKSNQPTTPTPQSSQPSSTPRNTPLDNKKIIEKPTDIEHSKKEITNEKRQNSKATNQVDKFGINVYLIFHYFLLIFYH
jgi:hypothetical protein